MRPLRFAVLGSRFWAQFQIAAWGEVEGAELVAIYNRTRARAEATAQRFGIPAVYDDAEAMFATEKLDFVDIITHPGTFSHFVPLAAKHHLPVICQKPMAPDLETAHEMVRVCREAGVPFFVHENWRWQPQIRELKRTLEEADVGRPFRARLMYSSNHPVFVNEPHLRDLEQFMLTDMGTHILDVARYLFGEASCLYCQTRRVDATIKGEDVATVMMAMGDGVTVTCEMSYASRLEHQTFPQVCILVECEKGSVELALDYWIRTTTEAGTFAKQCPLPWYDWMDPVHQVVHASIVSCNAHLLEALRTGLQAETSGEDNLRTLELVYGSYESAAGRKVVLVGQGRQ
jgi:predicted dehydrogenase